MGIASFFGFNWPEQAHDSAVPPSTLLSGNSSADARRMRFACSLTNEQHSLSKGEIRRLWSHLEKQMALVPKGSVPMIPAAMSADIRRSEGRQRPKLELVDVESFYMDRTAVSNAEFAVFVQDRGYSNLDLWQPLIRPMISQFQDQTGKPGPRFWRDGRYRREQGQHPVTGISWYEADAFARWCGKSLPTSVQWQQAAIWHTGQDGRYSTTLYPWGDVFDVRRANVWSSGIRDTVPVWKYYDGSTPNGIYQLIGNVWEILSCGFAGDEEPDQATTGLCEIRGGAYDTYFHKQFTCQFRTGQPRLSRTANSGFRCVLDCASIRHWPPMN